MSKSPSPRAARLRYGAALVVLLGIWLAMLAWGGGALDQSIYRAFYAGDRPALATAGHVFTAMGEPTVLIGASIAIGLWLYYAGHRHLPWVLVAIMMAGRGISELQKYWVARPRPELGEHLVVVKTMSFPSGHANSAMIFYLLLALVLMRGTRWYRASVAGAVVMALLVGASRVVLGVHWPSDVVGGWALGMLWVLLTLRIAQRFVSGRPDSG